MTIAYQLTKVSELRKRRLGQQLQDAQHVEATSKSKARKAQQGLEAALHAEASHLEQRFKSADVVPVKGTDLVCFFQTQRQLSAATRRARAAADQCDAEVDEAATARTAAAVAYSRGDQEHKQRLSLSKAARAETAAHEDAAEDEDTVEIYTLGGSV